MTIKWSALVGPQDSKDKLSAVTHITDGQDDLCSTMGKTSLEHVIMNMGSDSQLSGKGVNFLLHGYESQLLDQGRDAVN